MEKDIVEGQIGPHAKYDVEFKQGALRGFIEADFGVVKGKFEVSFPADGVIDAIKKAIPGQIDDAILDVLQSALKA